MISSRRACRAVIVAAVAVFALAAWPGAVPAEDGCGARHTVKPGDTLAGIAERCGTTVEALLAANARIDDPARISVGWELAVPGARASLGRDAEVRAAARDPAAEAALAAGTYEVRPGDSFASIATELQVPMRALIAANEGVDPFGLRPGQSLRLPEPPAGDEPGAGPAMGASEAQAGPAPAPGSDQPSADRTDANSAPPARTGGPTDGTESADGARTESADRDGTESADEGGTESADEGGTESADGQAESPSGAPSSRDPEDPAEPMLLQGRVLSGPECPVLATEEGELYSLVSAEYGFTPGDYVRIEGETVDLSFCMRGRATVRVTSMTAVPAPQGG